MVETIKQTKDKILERMERELQDGADRINVNEFSMLADVVKDLAEAEKACWESEYYRSVTVAMEGSSGYDGMGYDGNMGYGRGSQGNNQGGRSGYRRSGRGSANQYGGSRRGYDSMGFHDSLRSIKEEMQSADPQRRQQLVQELRRMTEGM